MQKPSRIVDRDPEWGNLTRMWESDAPELYLVRGRRRAGKSFLLTHFAAAAGGLYYQATKKTGREQLASLTRVVARRFQDPALQRADFRSWEDFFGYLLDRAGQERLVLVLDEFPYLVDAEPALPSILQSIWDHQLKQARIKLILSGSHITAMKRLTESDQPLYGRRTGLIQTDPLDYLHAAAFVPTYSPKEKVIAYGVFGGLPGHLTLLDPNASLVENAARQLLDPTARLHEEAVHAFDAFLGDAEVHYSIIHAIANGDVQWQKISNRVGKKSASLSRPLDWLKEMEVIEQYAPITAYPDPSPKSMLYRLKDPYLHFWHRFVAELRAQGIPSVLTPDEIWQEFIAPRLDDHIGQHVFEDVCRQFVTASRHERLPFRAHQAGAWWTTDGQHEIDLVALGPAGQVLLAECKWGDVNRDDVARLEARLAKILPELGAVREVHLALFVGGQVDPQIQPRIDAGELLLFTVADLFEA
ncbi:MAG: ATP-binding protein [Longimicrobiales bacterium]|nr:ATP-binding protein [Longimicrobiales bacterium]